VISRQCVIGAENCGKTALVMSFLGKKYEELQLDPTIGLQMKMIVLFLHYFRGFTSN
jgi:GTPase SAR1 family protein